MIIVMVAIWIVIEKRMTFKKLRLCSTDTVI
jgi:hypothetical protein